MAQMPTSSFDHDYHFIDEFVDLDDLLRETLPQLEEAVKEIDQKEMDQISSDEAQARQKKKRTKKEKRKKKIKKGVSSVSQRNEFEGDSKKELKCGIIGVGVDETYNGIQQPSTPHHTEATLVEAQVRNHKHTKKKRKMGSKDLQTLSPRQGKRFEPGSDLLSRKGSTQVLVGDGSQTVKKKRKMGSKDLHTLSPPQTKRFEHGSDLSSREGSTQVMVSDDSETIMSSESHSQSLTAEEAWKQRHLYLAMEACLQRLTFMKEEYTAILYSLRATIKHNQN